MTLKIWQSSKEPRNYPAEGLHNGNCALPLVTLMPATFIVDLFFKVK
jgi:hypothetical protein